MKKLVSPFFIPIYEAYFSKLKLKKTISESMKIADAIYHEREFVDWLKLKYKNTFTAKTYLKLTTIKNFNIYINEYHSIKNRVEEKEKRNLIFDQVRLAKLKPVSKHEYDVDIVSTYLKIEKLVESVVTVSEFNKEHYLEAMKSPVVMYCAKFDLPVAQILQMERPVVVQSKSIGFEAYLGRTLIAFDVNKIEAILNYQKAIWNRKELFASFVEHLVYHYVYNNSPFDNNIRLSKIMNWVEKNRVFLRPTDKSKKKVEKKSTLEYGIVKSQDSDFHYWPYSKNNLEELYNQLILHKMIKPNDSFYDHFKTYVTFPVNTIEWTGTQIQLMYLLYLIYNPAKHHKGSPVHDIARTLFKNSKNNFTQKGLNTTFNQLINDLETKKVLSIGLTIIRDIFNRLQL